MPPRYRRPKLLCRCGHGLFAHDYAGCWKMSRRLQDLEVAEAKTSAKDGFQRTVKMVSCYGMDNVKPSISAFIPMLDSHDLEVERENVRAITRSVIVGAGSTGAAVLHAFIVNRFSVADLETMMVLGRRIRAASIERPHTLTEFAHAVSFVCDAPMVATEPMLFPLPSPAALAAYSGRSATHTEPAPWPDLGGHFFVIDGQHRVSGWFHSHPAYVAERLILKLTEALQRFRQIRRALRQQHTDVTYEEREVPVLRSFTRRRENREDSLEDHLVSLAA